MNNDVGQLNKIIESIENSSVVENCNEWDWRSRFPDFESAVNILLKQLKMQRKMLHLSIVWQRNALLNKKLEKKYDRF
jgi:hypothetical protein